MNQSIDTSLVIDGLNRATDLLRADVYRHWLDGSQPYLRSTSFPFPVAVTSVLPADHAVERCATASDGVDAIARSSSSTISVESTITSTVVRVTAETDERAELLLSQVQAAAEQFRAESEETSTDIRVWWSGARGGTYVKRSVATRQWPTIRRNYARGTRTQLDRLMQLDTPPSGGRLILWYGQPGTGKTTALGALMRAWEPWCATFYISDPEQLFQDAGYLANVLTMPARDADGPSLQSAGPDITRARLLVAEDSDEYLRSSARREAGASLGRLLNLTDGMLGLGTKTFVLLTTNEELSRLHPALTRPGRCLASVEFDTFSSNEAAEWLDAPHVDGDCFTLAQLLQRRGDFGTEPVPAPNPRLKTGSYL